MSKNNNSKYLVNEMNQLQFHLKKPSNSEYNPFFQKYVAVVNIKGSFSDTYNKNSLKLIHYFSSLPVDKHNYKYQENKWTIKQVLRHIIDTERIFSYRLLVILRKDESTVIQEYNDNLYATNVDDTHTPLNNLLEEFKIIRRSISLLIENMTETQSKLHTSIGDYPMTARAIAYIILGHTEHHLKVLRERY